MLPLLFSFALLQTSDPFLDQVDRFARAKDADGLYRLLSDPKPAKNPFSVIRTGGAYDVGRFGWKALDLRSPLGQGRYLVLSTPLTSEDTGELVFRRVGSKLTYLPETNALGVYPVRHSFDLRFDLSSKKAILKDDLELRQDAKSGNEFLFRMSPNYRVESIRDGAGKAVRFSQSGGVVLVPRQGGQRFRLSVNYSGTVDLRHYAGSISTEEASLTNDYWYPMIARWPAAYDLKVRTQADWTAVAQGRLLSRTIDGGEAMWQFRMDLPVVYYSFAAGPYKKIEETIGSLRYPVWSAMSTEQAMRSQAMLGSAPIEFFSKAFAPYPFEHYGVLESAAYGGGALEAYSYATWGGGIPFEDAHEPAHTWWGGLINNTYLKSFWNESFAVYSDGLYHREAPIGNRDERRLAFIQDGGASSSYNAAPLIDSGAEIGGVASSLGYGKGAKVLQMLEQVIGTDAMIGTMREWVKVHPKGVPGEWEDYEAVVKRLHPEQFVSEFLRDWLHKPGFAKLDVKNVTYSAGKVQLDIRSNFHMPLDVLLETPNGGRSIHTLRVSPSVTSYAIESERPRGVAVDPWRRALRQISEQEHPATIESILPRSSRFTDPAHPEYLPGLRSRRALDSVPGDLNGTFLVGSPETLPVLKPLFEKAGFRVVGNQLTYDGTTVDLNRGAALAIVPLEGGGSCVIGIGRTRVRPTLGRARLAVVDDLGRVVRAKTDPAPARLLVSGE